MRRVNGRFRLSSTSFFLATAFWCAGACAQTLVHFDLPAQPLSQSLRAIGSATNTNVGFSATQVAGLQAPPLKADLTVDGALQRVLAGTGLRPKHLDDHTIAIVIASAESSRKASAEVKLSSIKALEAEPYDQFITPRTEGPGDPPDNPSPSNERKKDLDEIVVTGTHIKGAAPVGSPILVISEEAIRRSGYTSTEQLIQSLPENIRGGAEGATADHAMSVGGAGGFNISNGSGANLRGLGSVATLVLINGRRYADSTSGGFVDLSLIPVAAIERIEILTDGSSAIYGADAVAGVINIILKKNYDGAESSARYGFTDPSGRDETRLSQSLGKNWASGNALVVLDYLHQSELSVTDRSFTSAVEAPASILPSNKQLGAVFSGTQALGDMWSVQADAQYAHVDRFSDATFDPTIYRVPVTIDRINTAASIVYSPFTDWNISLDGSFSRESVFQDQEAFSPGEVSPDPDASLNYFQTQRQTSFGGSATGTLFSVPAGGVGVAMGISRRSEDYRYNSYSPDLVYVNSGTADRKVDSAYIEMRVPLVDQQNAIGGVQRLLLSLAGRYDHYSDFGRTINPRIGLSWSPLMSLELRSTYSTSFRAPSTGNELLTSLEGANRNVGIYSLEAPDGTGTVPTAFLLGANTLQAEKARNWTAGFTFKPEPLVGLQIGGTYYDIRYSNRIVQPPFDQGALSNPALQSFIRQYPTPAALLAALTQLIRGVPVFFDSTGPDFNGGAFGPNPQNVTTYLFDDRYTNAELVRTSGLDLTADYKVELLGGMLDLGLNANRIFKIDTVFAPGAPSTDLVGTTGNPASSRFRTTAAYARSGWDAAVAINYTSSYTDTTGPTPTGIGSWVTLDSTLRFTVRNATSSTLNNSSISLSVTNLFDRDPPYVQSTLAGAHYDSANANPLGRLIAIEYSKRW